MKSALTWKTKHEKEYPKKVAKATKQGRPAPRFKPVTCPASLIASIRYDEHSYWVKWNLSTCSTCEYQHRFNRRSQSFFQCHKCGYCLNADLNAAYNIREKYLSSLASVGTPSLVGSPVKLPIVSTVRSEGQAPSRRERGT